jgi:glycosyltransferase involved in cell wall biosynthesis
MPGESKEASREDRPRDPAGTRGEVPPELRELRVALVHDWLTGMRGGEKGLEVFCEIFPRAHIHTLFHFPGTVSSTIERLPIHTSFLQRLPGLERWYRYFLPLFPRAIRGFDLSGYDLIVSSSHCVAKGAGAGSGVPHVSYCFTPMRYIWDQAAVYFDPGRYSRWKLFAIERMLRRLRRWDRATHPTEYISISRFVAERVRRIYGRESRVIYPPVDMGRFQIKGAPEDFYLIVSALTPYKRVDLAVRALGRLGRRLIVVGKGEEEARLRKMAGPGVSFLGWASDAEVADLFSRCRASLLPGEEDFGITPLEAMASGRPVVALGKGGATETVVDIRRAGASSPTGILFDEPTEDSLCAAILELERRSGEFQPEAIRRHAERFSLERFRSEISEALRRFALEAVSPGPR